MELDVLTARSLGGLKVQSVSEQEPYLNIFVYGEPGAGKTWLAGTAADVEDLCPVLFLDVEGGTFTIRGRSEIDVVRARNFNEVQKIYDELYNGSKYKTLVVDSLTEMQKFSMQSIMEALVKTDPSRDPDIPSVREWGKSIEQIRRMSRAFRDLPMNVIFTGLVATERDTRTGLTMNRPSLPGKLSGEVAGFFDEVLFLYVTRQQTGEDIVLTRKLLTQKTDTTIAKDRSGKLPVTVDDPTMYTLHTTMFGGN